MSQGAPLDHAAVERYYRTANAARWGLSHDAFAALLDASARRAFPGGLPSASRLDAYFSSLHLDDLALACACAEGIDEAWDHFVLTYRPVLYRAADATSDPARGREVADSLYGELFGLRVRDGERHSHFRYFHGRSSLGTWLRAVLAQRYVDALRRTSRLDALPEDDSAEALTSPSPAAGSRPSSMTRYLEVLQRVIAAVVQALPPRDRLRLRCYYAQDLTLAQIGQLLGEHEGTASRNLAKTRHAIRKQVEDRLRAGEGMTDAEIGECLAAAVADSGPLDLVDLLGSEPDPAMLRKEVVPDRSK